MIFITLEAKHRGGTYIGFALHAVHGHLDGHRHKALHFFGAASGPFRYDDDLGVGHVWKCFQRSMEVAAILPAMVNSPTQKKVKKRFLSENPTMFRMNLFMLSGT